MCLGSKWMNTAIVMFIGNIEINLNLINSFKIFSIWKILNNSLQNN